MLFHTGFPVSGAPGAGAMFTCTGIPQCWRMVRAKLTAWSGGIAAFTDLLLGRWHADPERLAVAPCRELDYVVSAPDEHAEGKPRHLLRRALADLFDDLHDGPREVRADEMQQRLFLFRVQVERQRDRRH